MLVLSSTNQKGGVAKTTTSLCMAYGLADRGYRVLAVDLDAQRNMSSTLGSDESYKTSLDVMAGTPISEAIQHCGNLDFISASPRANSVDDIIGSAGRDHRLAKALLAVSDDYDFAVVDTPPSLGTLTINALTACDWVVIPTIASTFDLDGVLALSSTIDAVREYTNPSLRIAGLLLTRFSPRSNLSQLILDVAKTTANTLDTQVFKTTIREGVAVREAQAVKEDLFDFAPKSKVAKDYSAFIDELLGVIDGNKD